MKRWHLLLLAFFASVIMGGLILLPADPPTPVQGKHIEDKPGNVYVYGIFEKPKDYPQGWVVRKFLVEGTPANVKMTPADFWTADSLEAARKHVPEGKTRMPRQPSDPEFLMESWF